MLGSRMSRAMSTASASTAACFVMRTPPVTNAMLKHGALVETLQPGTKVEIGTEVATFATSHDRSSTTIKETFEIVATSRGYLASILQAPRSAPTPGAPFAIIVNTMDECSRFLRPTPSS